MVCPSGTVLKRSTDTEVCLGITPELDPDRVYDVAVVGAGPAGLATAVCRIGGPVGAVSDQRAFGGQAGGVGANRELSWFSNRYLGHGACGRAFSQTLR
jgi:thioredoxin reductase (NADPH)